MAAQLHLQAAPSLDPEGIKAGDAASPPRSELVAGTATRGRCLGAGEAGAAAPQVSLLEACLGRVNCSQFLVPRTAS